MNLDLRRAILDYRDYVATGTEWRHDGKAVFRFTEPASHSRLETLRLAVIRSMESAPIDDATQSACALLAVEGGLWMTSVRVAGGLKLNPQAECSVPYTLPDALDRALSRLPAPTNKKKRGAWLPAALLILKNTEGRMSDRKIAADDTVNVDPGTISRNKVFQQARAAYASDAPPRGLKNGETGDVDAYDSKPVRNK